MGEGWRREEKMGGQQRKMESSTKSIKVKTPCQIHSLHFGYVVDKAVEISIKNGLGRTEQYC